MLEKTLHRISKRIRNKRILNYDIRSSHINKINMNLNITIKNILHLKF